jgi:1-acyl-sn-glycerol-3-phosphate acyltransferase
VGDRFYRSIVGGARGALAGLRLDVQTTGAQHIPSEGGAVLAANHLGFFDFIFVGAAARERGRLVRFMCKKEVFDHPVMGPAMRGMGHIPVDRESGGASYAEALRNLRAGELVGLFPEATISRSFEPMKFKTGATAMAAAAGVPLLPVGIWGSQRAWTKAGHHFLPTERIPIRVAIGEPIPVERRGDHTEATERLRQAVTALVHDLQEHYPVKPRRGDDWWLPARLGGSAPTPEEGARLDAERAQQKAAERAAKAAKQPRAGSQSD